KCTKRKPATLRGGFPTLHGSCPINNPAQRLVGLRMTAEKVCGPSMVARVATAPLFRLPAGAGRLSLHHLQEKGVPIHREGQRLRAVKVELWLFSPAWLER